MVQFDPLDPGDVVGRTPAVRGQVRAAAHQPVQHGQEHRPLERKAVLAPSRQSLDHRAAAGLPPQPLEHQPRPEPPHLDLACRTLLHRHQHHRLGGEARTRAQQPLQLAAPRQLVEPAERGNHLLPDARPLAPGMDDLQIGAPAGGLLAEVHGATRLVVRTKSPSDAHKSSAIAPRRGTTLFASSTQEWRISAGFRASPSPNC